MKCKQCNTKLSTFDFQQGKCLNCQQYLTDWEKNQLLREWKRDSWLNQIGFMRWGGMLK